MLSPRSPRARAPRTDFWATAELTHRLVVTGWVLLIPAEHSFLRLLVSLLASLAMLVATLFALPYRRVEDNMLATAALLLLVGIYIGSLFIKVLEDVEAAAVAVGQPGLAGRVLGFNSTSDVAAGLVAAACTMLVLFVLSSILSLRREKQIATMRLKDTMAQPELTLHPSHRWMLFISHVSPPPSRLSP